MNPRRKDGGTLPAAAELRTEERMVLSEEAFQRTMSLERKRSERSRKAFILMLLDMCNEQSSERARQSLDTIANLLSANTRETDIVGWHKNARVIGAMLTEIALEDRSTSLDTMVARVTELLRANLTPEQFDQIGISFHVFPEEWNQRDKQRGSNPTLYPDIAKREDSRRLFRVIKRAMDIVGSLAALIAFAPMFLMIAAAIKLTSKGPVLFQQRRIGQHGVPFVLLKFRSMYSGNDAAIHEEYVKKLIAGKAEKHASNGNDDGVYKLTKDPRVTPIGAFLRKSSLDEFPQFFNVLRGEMSLVGPRPPLPYEVEAYDVWHRCRLLEAKPGITGLWQVNGRSRVSFDEMVRLDLRYARSWSPWMDVKILLRTPRAVVIGDGAH